MANPSSWICPNCHRRVPHYSPVCHCGTQRADANRASLAPSGLPGRGGSKHDLPRSLWLLLGIVGLVVLVLIALLFVPPEPPPRVPLLGHVDRRPTPAPKR